MERYPNKRIRIRDSKGKFSKLHLDVDICSCGQIVPKETKNIGTKDFPMMKKVSNRYCPNCGKKLK
jgi:hypothetical protein